MDFTFTEVQQAAVEAARAAFADVAVDGVPSPAVNSEPVAEDVDRELWQRLAKSDLPGLALAETYGGSGLDPVAWCLVLRESARVLARVPLLETGAAALAVQRYGSEAQRRQLLPEVAAGRLLLGVAPHGRTGHEPADHGVRAVPADASAASGGGWILDGAQTGVTAAQVLDRIVVPARCAQGTLLLLVDPHAPGVELRRQVTAHGELAAEMVFDGARVDVSAQLGEPVPDAANWLYLRGLLIVGTAALCLGLGEQILRMTADYTSRREQFGHPIATFQAVSMQVADRYIDLRAMEVTLWQAAWRLGLATAAEGPDGSDGPDGPDGLDGLDDPERIPLAADLATAKVWSAEGIRSIAASAQHLHGGMGADLDYPLHRYHAWAKHLELFLGPAAAFEDEVATILAEYQL